jgi:hypothetical protein
MPTHLVRKWAAELAKRLRNQQDYDDFEYGTEVIPGDKTWAKKCNACKTCTCTIDSKQEKK